MPRPYASQAPPPSLPRGQAPPPSHSLAGCLARTSGRRPFTIPSPASSSLTQRPRYPRSVRTAARARVLREAADDSELPLLPRPEPRPRETFHSAYPRPPARARALWECGDSAWPGRPVGTDSPKAGSGRSAHEGEPGGRTARSAGAITGPSERSKATAEGRAGRTAPGAAGGAGPEGRRAGAGRRNSPAPPACAPIGLHPSVTSRQREWENPRWSRECGGGAGREERAWHCAGSGYASLPIALAETAEACRGPLAPYP